MSTKSMTKAVLSPLPELDKYRSTLRWLLDFNKAGIPAPTALAEYFWSAPLQLTNEYWSSGPWTAFQSVLAYPLWFFSANNNGNIDLLNPDQDLSQDFYTTASIASPYTRVVVNQAMFIVFVIFEVSHALSPALHQYDVNPPATNFVSVLFSSQPGLQLSRSGSGT